MLHQISTVIIGAGSCWLFLLLGWAAVSTQNVHPIVCVGMNCDVYTVLFSQPYMSSVVALEPLYAKCPLATGLLLLLVAEHTLPRVHKPQAALPGVSNRVCAAPLQSAAAHYRYFATSESSTKLPGDYDAVTGLLANMSTALQPHGASTNNASLYFRCAT
jgi:hypothetical protein